ncbi:PHP C-terminal domain protein [Veillonella parvula HSIVP1]|nr:PHP domain-containing protein [Veillonella parvula]EQC65545.1 PHP C-terminal domain protein [Veillonella parvula HSIVP1]
MLVDFHMHSIFSDGVETPKDLLQHAIDCNVSMMALTDHDEIDGIQALRAAQKKLDPNESIKIVNGCEFSADYKDKSIHILGYCFDENNKDLIDFITFLKENVKNVSMKLSVVVTMKDIILQKKSSLNNFLILKLMVAHILVNF